jgi:phage baseplate assembly protein W
MLTITDFNGNDLIFSPPADAKILAPPNIGAQFKVNVMVEENDATLPSAYINGTVDWHDGSLPSVYSGTGTLAIDTFKFLLPGNYFISVIGQNFKAPTPSKVEVNYFVTVISSSLQAPPANILVGPILPKDTGFPNAEQWDFNTSTDINLLDSSLKMLLMTDKGERVMLPEYGTNLRQIIFQQNVQGIESLVQQEIVGAVTIWEPRVQLMGITVTRNDNKSVTVNAQFMSKLDQTGFTTNLTFQP